MMVQGSSAPQRSHPPSRAASGRWWARVAGVLALSTLVMCDSIDNFEVEVASKAKVPAATIVDKLLGAFDFDAFQSVDLSAEFKNQGVTKGDVDSVRLLRFTLTTESPAGATFDFLDSISFFAEADGAPKVLIAKLESVPRGATTLELDLGENVELKPYVVAPKMRITAEVRGSRPDQETTVGADVALDVDVTLPGC